MNVRAFSSSFAILLSFSGAALAATLEVGPGKTYSAPCAAIAAAQAGDTITVDAAGTYVGDVCGIATNGLTIKGVNGRPKIDAGGKIAQGKGLWAVSGNDLTVENVELFGAHSANGPSPGDQNAAGIRGQGTNLTVRGCYIHDNDNGILGGGITDAVGNVTIEGTEFAHNGFGDGYSHNVYVNHVAKLVFRFNYSHDVAEGHLLKSRADTNVIAYNRLTGEGGTDSYEVDLPNGGVAYVVGNVIQQPATTHNPGIITFAEEGPHANGTPDHLFVVNNTVVNDLGKGTFVTVGSGVTTPAIVTNNAFVGVGTPCSQASAVLANNFTMDPKLANMASFDYHLLAGSACIDAGAPPGMGDGFDLTPMFEYVHPAASAPRTAVGKLDIGAYEYGNPAGGAGGSGQAGSGQAGTGQAGSGQAGKGQAGSGQAGSGQAGTGQAGTGQAGTGQAGSAGKAGVGGAGTGGSGAAGKGGATAGKGGGVGTAGATAGGSGGAAPTNGAADSGDKGGCGCTTATATPRFGALGLGLALLVLARRRRRLLHLGERAGEHAIGSLAIVRLLRPILGVDQTKRVHPVDLTEKRRVNAVAEHRPRAITVAPSDVGRRDEELRLLGSEPRLAVLGADAEARPAARVRAPAVPRRAVEDERGAGRHHRRHDLVRVLVGVLAPPKVAPGNHLRRAVFDGEGLERPDDGDRERRGTRPRSAIERVVGVPRLRGLAGMEANRLQRREQEARREERVDEREDARILGEVEEYFALPGEAVHALRPLALEVVAPHRSIALEGRERGGELRDLFFAHGVLEDDEPIALKTLERARLHRHSSGAQVDTPAPTISCGRAATSTTSPFFGSYFVSRGAPPGEVKSQKSPPQNPNAQPSPRGTPGSFTLAPIAAVFLSI